MEPKLQEDITAVLYEAARTVCEERESTGMLRGNGHHMAQEIVRLAEQELVRRKLFTVDRGGQDRIVGLDEEWTRVLALIEGLATKDRYRALLVMRAFTEQR